MKKDFEQEGYSSNGAVMNKSRKLIEARHYPRLLNDYWVFGKVGLVSFIAISIAILFLTSVTQAHASTVSAQSPLPHQTQKETLIVGSEQDYPPFATGMTDADAGGFTVELWKAVAAEAGLSYTIRVNPFREVLQNFKDGETDVLINLGHLEERDQFADFTVPHVIVHGAVFVREGETSIRSEDDLVGKSIIVLNADMAHVYALTKGWKQQLVLVDTAAEGFRLLASGKHDAILIGKLPGMQTVLNMGLTDIKVLKFNAGFAQKFGFAVHEGQSELLAKINEGLAIVKANGTYDLLYQKWFGLYKVIEVGLQDLLKYIIPIVLFFLGVGGYFFYRRQVERQVAAEALRESEERFNLAITGTGAGLWDWDMVNDTVYFSLQWKAMLGYEDHEIENAFSGWKKLWHPDDVTRIEEALKDYLDEKTTRYEIEHRLRHKDGDWRWILTRGDIIKDHDGKPYRWVGTNLDITARKQVEEDIEKLARFTEEDPRAVVRVTKDGVLRYANPSSRTLLQLLGVRIGLALPDAWLELIRKATAGGTHETVNLVCGERTFSVTAGYVPGRDYINLYANDITDRLRLQEEFRQSQKLEAVGHLAGGVAHDFNNLLTGIISCTEFVIENLKPDSPVHKDLDDVLGLGYRAANLTRQLLAFSRSQPLEPIVLRPNDLIENYAEMMGRLIGEDIAVELDLDPDLGNVLADPGQLEQVILNLAVNARDAMPGGGALHIQTENVVLDDEFIQRNQIAAPGPYILISIRDTGCGMEPATLSKMFDPFFTTKKQTKGTGLGMPTVYGIVAQHNGGIRAESTPGKGTEFFIYLPRVNEEPTQAEPQAGTIGGGTETILVAEDDTIVRKITERYLGQLGYTVLSAPGGPEAVETAKGHKGKIDLLLTDVVMPEMGGRELFDKISAEREELKVLYMSGYTDNAIVHHGVLDKGLVFLNKPFQKNALAVKVRRALNNAHAPRQDDPAQKPESPATILIIDDEELVREILTRVLRRLGHNVLPASGGEEALSIYGEKKDEIDLVIVDINMPKMSGIEVAGRLRSINPKVTVIGSSGESDQDLNETKVKKIFDGYISKPYGISMLSAAVSRFLDARPGDSHR